MKLISFKKINEKEIFGRMLTYEVDGVHPMLTADSSTDNPAKATDNEIFLPKVLRITDLVKKDQLATEIKITGPARKRNKWVGPEQTLIFNNPTLDEYAKMEWVSVMLEEYENEHGVLTRDSRYWTQEYLQRRAGAALANALDAIELGKSGVALANDLNRFNRLRIVDAMQELQFWIGEDMKQFDVNELLANCPTTQENLPETTVEILQAIHAGENYKELIKIIIGDANPEQNKVKLYRTLINVILAFRESKREINKDKKF